MRLIPGFLAAILLTPAFLHGQRVAGGAGAARSAPISGVHYVVRFDRTTAPRRALDVTMQFGVSGNDPVLLSVPAWTPGSYEISNFSRSISSFAVSGEAGTPRWDKYDPDTWRIFPQGARRLSVTFSFAADTLDNAMAWARPDFAFFNGTNLLPYPEGRGTDFEASVTIATESDWQVMTGMAPDTAPRTYRARNYHDLVDMPFFVGTLEIDSMRIADRWVRTATYPRGVLSGAPRDRFWRDLEGMLPPMIRVFGEMPATTYTTLIVFDSSMAGAAALEHQNSHVGIYSPFIVGHEFLPSITAHEIFHLWNVKRMRPADMVPYRYDQEQPTTWLWVSEGITDYYADLAQVRGGIVDSARFLGLTSEKMGEVAAGPVVALEDASLSTWIRPTDGSQYIYYPKGALAGLMLDILIRDGSDNRQSLDDVMRNVYQSTYKAGRGFTSQDWWNAVSKAAGGKSFADFNRRYVDGREPYPWSSLLPLAGLRLNVDSIRQPWIGLGTMVDSTGALRVTLIEPGSAAEEAGFRLDDQLLRIGDLEVSDPDFGVKFRTRFGTREGEVIPVAIVRDGSPRTLSLSVRQRVRTVETIVLDQSASPRAVRIRSGILHGTTDGQARH